MSNTFTRGDEGNYPTAHNKREKRLIDTIYSNSEAHGVSELAAEAADYAITTLDGYKVFIVNDGITITLPDASDNAGRKILFIQLGSATLVIGQNADDANIAGADADLTTLNAAGDRIELVSTGIEWLEISSTIA